MATDRILMTTDLLAIGRFVCPPGDERWRRENWIGAAHHVVFPSRAVLIEQSGHQPVVADANHVVLYDAGRKYRRELLSTDGDVATYLVVGRQLVGELLGSSGDEAPSFGAPQVGIAPAPLLALRLLIAEIRDRRIDTLEAEERALGIVQSVIGASDPNRRSAPSASRRQTRRWHDELVLDTKRLLGLRYADRLSLGEIGRLLGASPFHLARLFRAATGSSLHEYREQLRLRDALDRLTDASAPTNLGWMAADLGFASHAHFDDRFRRTFGQTPSAVRRPSVRRGAEIRTISKTQAAPAS